MDDRTDGPGLIFNGSRASNGVRDSRTGVFLHQGLYKILDGSMVVQKVAGL